MARPKREESPGRLSPSEWEIMMICWRLGRANVRQILREDLKTRIRDYRTILTFVSRIAKKGWLDVEMEGNTNYYSAAIPQEEGLKLEIDRFLSETVGSDPEHLELLQEALEARLRKARPRRLKNN
ncbi:MAG: BlaI/MecI/CopY family transcriptional regulator [Thermoanaerobaculia bacterium]